MFTLIGENQKIINIHEITMNVSIKINDLTLEIKKKTLFRWLTLYQEVETSFMLDNLTI